MNNPIVLVAARGSSKRIERKNLQEVGGKPLVYYPISNALECFEEVFVSTEDSEIAKISKDYGATIIDRPKDLSDDNSSVEDVIKDAIDQLDLNNEGEKDIIILSACSPFCKFESILKAYDKFIKSNYDTIFSVNKNYDDYWISNDGVFERVREGEARRQQDRGPYFIENSAFYITKVKNLMNCEYILEGNVYGFEIDYIESIDINTQIDLDYANFLYNKMQNDQT